MEAEIGLIEAPGLIAQQPGHGAAAIFANVLPNVAASWLASIRAATSAPPTVLK
ncbi:MAG: hypothetical protein WAU59_05145 [Rhodoplanes sp.]